MDFEVFENQIQEAFDADLSDAEIEAIEQKFSVVYQEIGLGKILGAQLAAAKILEANIVMGEDYEKVLNERVVENLLFVKLHGLLRVPKME